MLTITGSLQQYPWGIPGGLRSWLSPAQNGGTAGPEAELWFGAHANGPSPLCGNAAATLRDRVAPADVPLLVKLLAAARPLSIQVHPPTDQAAAGFGAQVADPGLPKLLADGIAKTEMLIALKPCSALRGFRDPDVAADILRRVGGQAAAAEDPLRVGNVADAIRLLLTLPESELAPAGDRMPAAAAAAGLDAPAVRALATVAHYYSGDPGVLVSLLLDHVSLDRGEAVYLPAGVPHAYVFGTGVEVMTASDNVLRLGLTDKTIAIDAALEAIQMDLAPEVLRPTVEELPAGGSIRRFRPSGAPFEVTWVESGRCDFPGPNYRLVLVTGGRAEVEVGSGDSAMVGRGEAAVVLSGDGSVSVAAEGVAFVCEARPGSQR